MNRRRAFTIIEILVAFAILSFCVPIFVLSRQNLAADRVHRVRLAAESLCHNTLERFGQAENDLVRYLKPSESDPGSFDGADLWSDPQLFRDLGAAAVGPLLAGHDMHMEIRLHRGIREDLDLLVCRVSWVPETGSRERDSITYARHVLREGAQ